jgi:glycerol-3-phosphate acyltransferase PlsX
MRTLAGVSRPGIAVILPTFHGPVVICDVGANISPKPKHFEQYAIMAGAYSTAVCGVKNPRVGLLSIGEEDAKGTTTVKEARKLMRDEPQINFVGNVEGRDLFKGVVDVVVCDGFVGNIVLKFTEGMADGLFKTIAAEIQHHAPTLVDQFKPIMKKIYSNHDWQEYGGAPLLGVGGYCLI